MLNKVILMGRLTRDPELRRTSNDTSVTAFTLAVDRSYKKSADSSQPTADFINIVAWSNQAEFVSKYFRKGMLVAVSGRLQSRKYTDKDGNNREVYEVVAEELHFAESKRDSNSQGGQNYAADPRRQNYAAPSQPAAAAPSAGFSDMTDDSDDLPF